LEQPLERFLDTTRADRLADWLRGGHLEDGGLVLAVGSVETREARAGSVAEVANTSSGAIAAGLVAIAVQRISARGALLQLAGGSAVASITEASDVFHGVPRSVVGAAGFVCKVLLGPASTAVIAVIRAGRTLACNTIITREALALASLAVARSLVGALHPGVQVVRVDDITNPGEVARAGAQRAVGAGPLRLAVQTCEALAVVVHLACAVVGAVILAQTAVAVAALVPGDLAPCLRSESGGTGGWGSGSSRAITYIIGTSRCVKTIAACGFRAGSAVVVSGAHCAFLTSSAVCAANGAKVDISCAIQTNAVAIGSCGGTSGGIWYSDCIAGDFGNTTGTV